MKVLYDYKPLNSSDASVVITTSPSLANFPYSNLSSIEPTKSWKSLDASGSKYIKYDAGYGQKFNVNTLFLNRFNFANFTIQGSDDDFSSTPFSLSVTGCVRDDRYDANTSLLATDNFMSYWATLTAFNYRYLRLYIPSQTPLFESSYFKVGNLLIGNSVDIWNPKNGMSILDIPNLSIIEFDSGYDSFYKKGKAYKIFEGEFNRIQKTELLKIRNCINPFVLYFDWTGNAQECYLVRNVREFKRSFEMADIFNKPFSFKEVV